MLKLKIDGKGMDGLDIVKKVPLRDMDGKEFAPRTIDPESVRYDAATDTLIWSSEGDARGRPGIYEAKTNGTMLRQFKLPDYYMPSADGKTGTLDNLSFENLAISSEGKSLFASDRNPAPRCRRIPRPRTTRRWAG